MNNSNDQLFTIVEEAIINFPDNSEDGEEISPGEHEEENLTCRGPSNGEYQRPHRNMNSRNTRFLNSLIIIVYYLCCVFKNMLIY